MEIKQSISWAKLEPLHLEEFQEYYQRISMVNKFNHIPHDVFQQWIYPHYQNPYNIRNYSWMNYYSMSFELTEFNLKELLSISIIPEYQNMVEGIDDPLEKVCAIEEDMKVWKEHGTWRIPPIILDIKTINNKLPKHASLTGDYQLVEGHSRYRNLLITEYQKLFLAKSHKTYIMKLD
jgi:hypothetical protein